MTLSTATVPQTPPQPSAITLSNISKTYGSLRVLDDVHLAIDEGEMVALVGASGSGKSTLLGILGLLEEPSGGEYWLRGKDTRGLADGEQAELRNRTLGFVFQQFHLLPELSALDNVARPLRWAGVSVQERRKRALEQLRQLGMEHRAGHRPAQLSGGEQQRVAIARALVGNPDIVLADEPTGNLPQTMWNEVLDILSDLHAQGKTVVIVTHDPLVASRAQRVIELKDGRVI